jgi:hypothetical protein
MTFVFLTNNFVNSPKKGQKNCQKTENWSRIFVCHYTENGLWDFFLELNIESRKNIDFAQIRNLSPTWHMDTPLKIRHFKNDFKKKSSYVTSILFLKLNLQNL